MMKVTRLLAILVVVMAILMTGLGGLLDSWKGAGGGLVITRQHAWNDGIFLVLLGIFLMHF